MPRIALLLRGVNVGGVTVRSADLAEVLAGAGMHDVVTVLASGNAVVRLDATAGEAARLAEQAIEARYGRRIRVLGIDVSDLVLVIDAYPFVEDDEHTPYVVFDLGGATHALLEVETPEQVAAGVGVVYWSNQKGTMLDSAFGRALPKAGDAVTTRNLRTLRRIVAKA